MSYLATDITPRARLFEFLRQEDVAQRQGTVLHEPVTPDAIVAFQAVALKSLQRRVR